VTAAEKKPKTRDTYSRPTIGDHVQDPRDGTTVLLRTRTDAEDFTADPDYFFSRSREEARKRRKLDAEPDDAATRTELRTLFAVVAMHALIGRGKALDNLASDAVTYADAMIDRLGL
jgi:hypothetical protein